MKTVIVSKATLFSTLFTRDMLVELAVSAKFYSKEAAEEMADKPLNKPSKTMADLAAPRLRTALEQKFSQSASKDAYNAGNMEWELESAPEPEVKPEPKPAPDLDINDAGKNAKGKKTASKLTGAYVVAKKASSPSITGGDTGKWEIWQHIWTCRSFEEYFAKAPAKAQKKSGTIITAASEMSYAVRSGFVQPVVAG